MRKQSEDGTKLSPQGKCDEDQKAAAATAEASKPERSLHRNSTFRVQDRREAEESEVTSSAATSPSQADEKSDTADSAKEAFGGGENARVKGQLIEVDLSELREPAEDSASADTAVGPDDGEQRNVLGFFFKVRVCVWEF